MPTSSSANDLRIRLDLSDFVQDCSKFRWIFLPSDSILVINDLKAKILSEYDIEDNCDLELFLEEPFCLPAWESIRVLNCGDLVKVKVFKPSKKRKRVQDEIQDDDQRKSVKKVKITVATLEAEKKEMQTIIEQLRGKVQNLETKFEKQNTESTTISDDSSSSEDNEKVDHIKEATKVPEAEKDSSSSDDSTDNDPKEPPEKSIEAPNKSKRKRRRRRKPKNRNQLPQVLDQPKVLDHQSPPSVSSYSKSSNKISCEEVLLKSTSKASSPLTKLSTSIPNANGFEKLLSLAKSSPIHATVSNGINNETLKPIDSVPGPGSRIAFKVLELSESYTPEISNVKVGSVMNISNLGVEIKLDPAYAVSRSGKFEVNDEETPTSTDVIIVQASDLLDLKLVQR